MSVDYVTIVGTTSATGAGTFRSERPVNGRVVGVRNNSSGWGGTADYTFYRGTDVGGGTVYSETNAVGPFERIVGGSITGLGTGQGGYGIPCPGYLYLDVAQATVSTGGTVFVYYDEG